MTKLRQMFGISIISVFVLSMAFSLVSCSNANVHNYTGWYTAVEATCQNDGLEKRICLDCDHIEERVIKQKGHNETGWITQIEATCQREGKLIKRCSMCNVVTQTLYVEKTGHSYDNNWVQILAPTSEKAGRAARKCKHCDFYQQKEVLFQY